MLYNYINFLNKQDGGKQDIKWQKLQHNGVLFPPEYKPINTPLIYDGKEIILKSSAEEAAIFYVKYLNTNYINSKFKRNFWKDFKKLLGDNLGINELDKCDFSLIQRYVEREREQKMLVSKEEKEKRKIEQKKKDEKFLYAKIDGKQQPVGNFRIEPPGIFIGRGCHPLLGRIKKRIYPEDITINIGKEAVIPETGFPDRQWGEIVNNQEALWLAKWRENVTGKTKYVWLSDKSDFKADSDKDKFELARKLKRKLGAIKKINTENLTSENEKVRQLATALYFIDKLALRVGNEKGKKEADTVGVSSLRVEHVRLLGNDKVKLDFLSKDSVRYKKKFIVEPQIYRNLILFTENKKNKHQLFDLINSADINKYLQNFMKKLTSKVFRTMNASSLFQKELNKITAKFENYNEEDKINLILNEFNKANAKVALLCNHQKNINKNFEGNIQKMDDKILELRKKKRLLVDKKRRYKEKNKSIKSIQKKIKKSEDKIKKLKLKKKLKIELKNVSLGTSKVNYIDPRITVSFIKKHDIDINKLFTEALQNKFKWAMDVEEYKF